ncbi:hypothetical protein CKO25_18970 [Thiocapsa imhoffii]|uniref:DUF2135 domain-containing protein n=1 Tax=Thiocapsa imhoffii TaxID=382777 RepID=A0A9X1BA79_9GAMM|nr:hypothetical protein [Thiocapsa imhoffii]MBK1646682.1 hypothetical protein [Thiocapsa imhoffii]
MMPRRQSLSTVNLAMLDVIAGAMAAFLIIMVILLPYYDKDALDQQARVEVLQRSVADLEEALRSARAESEAARAHAGRTADEAELRRTIAELRDALRAARAEAAASDAQAGRAEAEAERQAQRAEDLARQLARTFLVLYVRWDTLDDVDLHVIDPSGAEFYWDGHKTIPGRPGELSEDSIIGPGNEVWEIRDAPAGEYRIEVKLYGIRDARKPVVVRGRLFHRDGSVVFNDVNLSRLGERRRIATIRVDERGGVSMR